MVPEVIQEFVQQVFDEALADIAKETGAKKVSGTLNRQTGEMEVRIEDGDQVMILNTIHPAWLLFGK